MSNKPKKVLFLSSCVRGGGAGWSLFYLLKYLDRTLIDPVVIVPARGIFDDGFKKLNVRVIEETLLHDRVNVQRFAKNNRLTAWLSRILNLTDFLSLIPKLVRFIKIENIDMVYCNNMMVKPIGALAAQLASTPCVMHVRNLHERFHRVFFYGSLARLSKVKLIIANSYASSKPYSAFVSQKLHVVHNGVDLSEFNESVISKGQFRQKNRIPKGVKVIGFSGNIIPRKGLETLIRAASRLLPENDNILFAVVGRVPVKNPINFRSRLEALTHSLRINDRFLFVGFYQDVRPALVDFDILVLPSLQEPFGRSIIEAMALGIPVVVSRVGGIPEIITHDENGLLVPPGDPGALADAIQRLLDDEYLRRRLAEAAQKKVIEDFDVRQYAEKIQDLLIQIGR